MIARILRTLADKLDPPERAAKRRLHEIVTANRKAPATRDYARNSAAQRGAGA